MWEELLKLCFFSIFIDIKQSKLELHEFNICELGWKINPD